MIVHVLRRAEAAALGPVVVATNSPEIEAAVRRCRRPRRHDRLRSRFRLRPDFRGAWQGRPRPDHAAIVVNVQGDLPTLEPATSPRRSRCSPTARSISRRWPRKSPPRRSATAPSVVKVVGTPVASGAVAGALFYPRRGPVRRRAALPSHRTLCVPPRGARAVRQRCRNRRWNSGKSWSSCGRWKPECASTWRSSMPRPFGVDTPADLARARAVLSGRS